MHVDLPALDLELQLFALLREARMLTLAGHAKQFARTVAMLDAEALEVQVGSDVDAL